MTKIAVLGHGVVGSGVVEVLDKNQKGISSRAKETIQVKYVLDLRDFPELPYADKFVKDFSIIENDPEIKIVVECIGGLHPAYEFVRRALEAGKSVVTSNKELVAAKGHELLTLAQARNLNFLFEASVGGGIPVLRPINQCMAANEVLEIAGILNGTTNFILTKMINEKMTFDDALALAQKLGYAERDPSADVDGADACRKICILAALAYGRHVYPEQVSTEGIRSITLEDVDYAAAWGGSIKLIGLAKPCEDGRIDICVAPMLVPDENQLSHVADVNNAIMTRGNATGDVVFYGRGAGKLPTASAVVADVIDCTKHFHARKYLFWEEGYPGMVRDAGDMVMPMYLRAAADDAEKAVSEIYGEYVKIDSDKAPAGEMAFIAPAASYAEQCEKKAQLEAKGVKVLGFIRVFND